MGAEVDGEADEVGIDFDDAGMRWGRSTTTAGATAWPAGRGGSERGGEVQPAGERRPATSVEGAVARHGLRGRGRWQGCGRARRRGAACEGVAVGKEVDGAGGEEEPKKEMRG